MRTSGKFCFPSILSSIEDALFTLKLNLLDLETCSRKYILHSLNFT